MKLEFLSHLDLSAASGLVHRDGFLYSVADDGLELLRTHTASQRGRTERRPGATFLVMTTLLLRVTTGLSQA